MDDDVEAVMPQTAETPIEQIVEEAQENHANSAPQEEFDHEQKAYEKTMVPLSALQKVREKKKELELELQWERQRNAQFAQAQQKPQEDDNSRYESATREEVKNSQDETIRMVEERIWIRNNQEKYEKVNELLPNFLKQRPHLAAAINLAPNRYEEAYALMEALTPKQQQQIREAPRPKKQEAPNAPGGVPKAAALNEAVDVMSMSDDEFAKWRQAKRRVR